MFTRLRGMGAVCVFVALSACGSSSSSESSGSGTSGQTSGGSSQPAEDDPMVQEGMVVANALRDEYVELKNAHEAAWQERIRIATGDDLNTIGPRYATVSADFNARAEQAWQSMNAAVGHLQQHRIDPFRQLINQSRSHVAIMRQMVESIQAELMEMQQSAAPAADAPPALEGGEPETTPPAE